MISRMPNGADLEGIVKDAVERAFIAGEESITTELLLACRKEAKSISDIQTAKIKEIRGKLKEYNIKPASAEAE